MSQKKNIDDALRKSAEATYQEIEDIRKEHSLFPTMVEFQKIQFRLMLEVSELRKEIIDTYRADPDLPEDITEINIKLYEKYNQLKIEHKVIEGRVGKYISNLRIKVNVLKDSLFQVISLTKLLTEADRSIDHRIEAVEKEKDAFEQKLIDDTSAAFNTARDKAKAAVIANPDDLEQAKAEMSKINKFISSIPDRIKRIEECRQKIDQLKKFQDKKLYLEKDKSDAEEALKDDIAKAFDAASQKAQAIIRANPEDLSSLQNEDLSGITDLNKFLATLSVRKAEIEAIDGLLDVNQQVYDAYIDEIDYITCLRDTINEHKGTVNKILSSFCCRNLTFKDQYYPELLKALEICNCDPEVAVMLTGDRLYSLYENHHEYFGN